MSEIISIPHNYFKIDLDYKLQNEEYMLFETASNSNYINILTTTILWVKLKDLFIIRDYYGNLDYYAPTYYKKYIKQKHNL